MDKTIKFMNTKEVAQALSCSLPTARRIMQREDFPLIRVGKNMKVNAEAFDEWTKTGEPAATTVTTGSQSKEDDSFVKYTENANHPKGLRGTEEDRPRNGLYSAGIAEDGEK